MTAKQRRPRAAALKQRIVSLVPRKKIVVPTADTSWLVARLQAKQIPQREIARRLGMDFASLNKSFRGKRPFRPHELTEIADICECTVDELLASMGFAAKVARTLRVTHEVTESGDVVRMPDEEHRDVTPSAGDPPGSKAAVFASDAGPLSALYGQIAVFAADELDAFGPEVMDRLAVIRYGEHPECVLGTVSRGSRWGRYRVTRFLSGEQIETSKLQRASAIVSIRAV